MSKGLYIRVAKGRGPEMEREFLAGYGRTRGWGIMREYCDLVFRERDSRELRDLIADSKRGRIEVLCCYEVGSNLGILKDAVRDLYERGLFVLDDVDTPKGRLMFNLLSAMAQYERETEGK